MSVSNSSAFVFDISRYDGIVSRNDSINSWNEENTNLLLEPYSYLLSFPGKELRSLLIDAFNIWYNIPVDDVAVIKDIVRCLHTGSLLFDDIQDNSDLRRGNTAAHVVYGIPKTLNTGLLCFGLSYKKIENLKLAKDGAQVYRQINNEFINVHNGQGMDVYWREHMICPSEDDYITMVNNKTSGMFKIAAILLAGCSENNIDLIPLCTLLGILYQIRDDYCNLASEDYTTKKGFCEDISEGKLSFPVICAVQADDKNAKLLDILKEHPTDEKRKKEALQILYDSGAMEYTKKVIQSLHRQAQDEVKRLGGNPMLTMFLSVLSV